MISTNMVGGNCRMTAAKLRDTLPRMSSQNSNSSGGNVFSNKGCCQVGTKWFEIEQGESGKDFIQVYQLLAVDSL